MRSSIAIPRARENISLFPEKTSARCLLLQFVPSASLAFGLASSHVHCALMALALICYRTSISRMAVCMTKSAENRTRKDLLSPHSRHNDWKCKSAPRLAAPVRKSLLLSDRGLGQEEARKAFARAEDEIMEILEAGIRWPEAGEHNFWERSPRSAPLPLMLGDTGGGAAAEGVSDSSPVHVVHITGVDSV